MPKGLKRAVSALLITFLVYCLLGFLLIPGIRLRVANQQLAQYATVPARLERIEFNPFSLELTLWGLRLGDENNPQLAFRRLYANLQLDSLWKRQLHLADVELEGAHTELLFDEKGQLSLFNLFEIPPSESPEPEQPSDPFPAAHRPHPTWPGSLHFQDLRPSEPVDFSFDPLGFERTNLNTLPDDGANDPGRHQPERRPPRPLGRRPDPGADHVRGHLSVKDIQLKAWWPYVRDNAPLVLGERRGRKPLQRLSPGPVQGHPAAARQGRPRFARRLQHRIRPQGKPLAKLASLDVAATTLDLAKQEVVLGEVRSQGLEAWAAREDGQLDWQKLFADFTPPPRRRLPPSRRKTPIPPLPRPTRRRPPARPAADGAAKAAVIASGDAGKDRPAEKDASVAETERATDDKESAKVAEGAADKVASKRRARLRRPARQPGRKRPRPAEIDKAASALRNSSPTLQRRLLRRKVPKKPPRGRPPSPGTSSCATPSCAATRRTWWIASRPPRSRWKSARWTSTCKNVDSLGKTPLRPQAQDRPRQPRPGPGQQPGGTRPVRR